MLTLIASSLILHLLPCAGIGVPGRPLSNDHPLVQESTYNWPFHARFEYDAPENLSDPLRLQDIDVAERATACTFDNRNFYEDGDIFKWSDDFPCITYKCKRGNIFLYNEGCPDPLVKKCAHVGYPWMVQCRTFLCTKTFRDDGMIEFKGNMTHVDCKDRVTNRCRRAGEIFRHTDQEGVMKEHCLCRPRDGWGYIECF